MTAAATIPTDLPAGVVHSEHVRAALNLNALDVTIGVHLDGRVVVDTETRLRVAGASLLAYPDDLTRIFADLGAHQAAELFTQRATRARILTAAGMA